MNDIYVIIKDNYLLEYWSPMSGTYENIIRPINGKIWSLIVNVYWKYISQVNIPKILNRNNVMNMKSWMK